MTLDEGSNVIAPGYGLPLNTFAGRRTILREKPPGTATHGLPGDVYRLKSPAAGAVYEWVCTTAGAGQGAVWRPLTGRAEPLLLRVPDVPVGVHVPPDRVLVGVAVALELLGLEVAVAVHVAPDVSALVRLRRHPTLERTVPKITDGLAISVSNM